MNLFIKLIIKPLRSLLKLLFNRIFYVALALVVQLAWLLIALFPAYGILQMGDDRNAGHRFSGCSVDRK